MRTVAYTFLLTVALASRGAERTSVFRVVSTQATHITSITSEGTIAWSNSVSNATCSVEWSPSADGIWITNDLPSQIQCTGRVGVLELPAPFMTGTPSTVVSRRFTETLSPVGAPSYLDINGDGQTNLTFNRYTDQTDDYPSTAWVESISVSGSEFILPPQSAGTTLGPPSTNTSEFQSYQFGRGLTHRGWSSSSGSYPWQPPWGEVTNAYLAVRLTIESRQHYGWVNIDFVDVPMGGSTNEYWPSCRLRGCAYETVPGKGITAGAER